VNSNQILKRTLSIHLPTLNEEQLVARTVEEILKVGRATLDAFEILAVNDGSTDRTGNILDLLAEKNPEIVVIHYSESRGVGWSYRECIERCRFDYMVSIPSDYRYTTNGLKSLFEGVSRADLVISYRPNQFQKRPFGRALLNRTYTLMMGLTFGHFLRDWSSATIFPTDAVREVGIMSNGYLYQAELVVTLLRRGKTYVEVPIELTPCEFSGSRAFRFKTLRDLGKTIWRLHVSQRGKRPQLSQKNNRPRPEPTQRFTID